MRLALVIASDYQLSAQLPTLSRTLEDADRFAAYLDRSDLDIAIEELAADRHLPQQFEEALREPGAPLSELIVYFAGYVVTAPGRDPSLILDGDRLGAFALPRLRRLVEESASRALVVIDAVPVAHDGAEPEEVAEAIGSALGRYGAVSVLVNVLPAVATSPGTSFTDLVLFCWDTALKSDASETELSGFDVFEMMRAEAAFDVFPAARYFPGRVDFDWAAGSLESDHEISGLRSTSDEELSVPGNGFGASLPQGAPLPAFTADFSAPLPPPAPGYARGALPSPLPVQPEALRAAAASVTFSNVPALRVPPPPPRSVPPPLRHEPPASSAPPPARSVPPPPPLVRSGFPPPLPARPPSAFPPPLPAPPPPRAARALEPLPPLQASLPDQEEELTEPGQPFAAIADESTLETPIAGSGGVLDTPRTPLAMASHGGFGEAEDTEVTAGPLRGPRSTLEALEALDEPRSEESASVEAVATDAPSSDASAFEAALAEATSAEAKLTEPSSLEAQATEAALVEAVTASDAALTDLLSIDSALPGAELEAGSPAAEAISAELSGADALATVAVEVPTGEVLSAEEGLSIESLLRDTRPTDAPTACPPTNATPANEAPASDAVPSELLATHEIASSAAAPHEAGLEQAGGDPDGLPLPPVGRRTLPSDFVTSVLEEAGIAMSEAATAEAVHELPSVLPPDLVPRTSLETHSGSQAAAEAEVLVRTEPRGALPSDLVARALEEAGVVASELPTRGERDVLEAFAVGEVSETESALSSTSETAPESGPAEAYDAADGAPMPSFASEDEGEAEAAMADAPMPSFASEDESSEDESEADRRMVSEPMPSFALDDAGDDADQGSLATRQRSTGLEPPSSPDEPLPSFAGDEDNDEEGGVALREGSLHASERFEQHGFAVAPESDAMLPSFASEEYAHDTELYAPPRGGSAASPLPPPLLHSPLPPPLVHSPLPPPLVHSSLPPPLVSGPLPSVPVPAPRGEDLVARGVLTEGEAEAAFDSRLPESPIASNLTELLPFETCLAQGNALFEAGDPEGARAEYEKALEHAPADRAGVAYGRLGALSRALGDRDAALMNYEIALELLPGDAAPLVALTELCVSSGEFARVEGYQRRYLEVQAEPEARAEVWAAMAGLWFEHAHDSERQRRVLTQWAEDLPEDPQPVALLASSYHEAGEHPVAIDVRRRFAERIQDPVRKAAELVEVARAICGYLRDSDFAIQIAMQALELYPGAVDAVEIVAALLEHEARWQELAAIYERIIAGMGDRALQLEVGPKLGALYRDKLGAPDRTIAAYERVLEGDPGRSDVRRQLVELYSARGEHALALLHCRGALKASPNDRELYRKIYSLLDKVGEADAAWNAAMVLDCLGEADINEQLVADAHRPSGLLSPKATVPEEFWGHGGLSPERDRELGEILAAVADAAVDVRASFLRKKKRLLRLTPEARHDLNTSTTTLAKSLLWTSKLLSVKAPDLYVLDEVPGDLSAAPSDTPSALVSKSLARGLSLAQLAFLWGRHLTLFRPEHYVAVFYPSVDELVTLVLGALVAGECPAFSEQAASSEVKKLGRDMRKKLHPGSYARLAAACVSFNPRGLEGRVRAWLRSVELTRGRAGLLACGDVAVAAELVRRHPVVGQTPEEEQVSDLLCFSVSDEYAKLRGRLGVAIA